MGHLPRLNVGASLNPVLNPLSLGAIKIVGLNPNGILFDFSVVLSRPKSVAATTVPGIAVQDCGATVDFGGDIDAVDDYGDGQAGAGA